MHRRSFLTAAALTPFVLRKVVAGTIQPSQRSASMWAYLWDIADEGYEPPLRRILDAGCTSVSLASAYHAGKFLAPHNPRRTVIFPEDGTVYFAPSSQRYHRVQPIVNSLVRDGHSLIRVRRTAELLGMETRAWVVCCHNTPLGQRYPDIVSENAFGDRLVHTLCPAHPDVREYLSDLVADIASQGVTAIELEALQFLGYAHGFHHEREGIPLNVVQKFLLSICFCAHCQSGSHDNEVDISAIRRYCRQTLERHFADPSAHFDVPETLDQLPAGIFAPFFQWRASVIADLVEEIADALPDQTVRLLPMMALDPTARRMAGVDPTLMTSALDEILVLGYVKDGATLRDLLVDLQSQIPGKGITVGFQVGTPESGGKAEFADRMAAARLLGITRFNFYNYGLIPYGNLSWIKESLQ